MRDLPNRYFDVCRAAALTLGFVGKDETPILELAAGLALLLRRSGFSESEVETMMVKAIRSVPDEYMDGILPFGTLN